MDLKLKILQEHANKNGDLCEVYRHTDLYDGEATTILAAMDELSKIVAIAFAKFINGHRLDFQTATPDGYWIGLDMKRYSTEELYDLFTQSKEYKELMDGK